MADVHDKDTRSYNMARIRSANTKPELLVRRFLFANGLRYRIHDKKLSGRPDIVLPRYKTAIFVNGCFWHGHHHCKNFVVPKTRSEFWLEKIEGNRQRDAENVFRLRNDGWNVLTVFECELKQERKFETLYNIVRCIKSCC